MTTQHTPTPWTYFAGTNSTDVMAKNGHHLARMASMASDAIDDAAFIVKAVNAHEALIAALEATLYTIRASSEDYDLLESYAKGLAALKLAKLG
jgi:hypothetical protein